MITVLLIVLLALWSGFGAIYGIAESLFGSDFNYWKIFLSGPCIWLIFIGYHIWAYFNNGKEF